jgi:hypothetical protein
MNLSIKLRLACPPSSGTPETLADMIAACCYTFNLRHIQRSPELKGFLSIMITVAKRCAASLGKETERAKLEALVANEKKLHDGRQTH